MAKSHHVVPATAGGWNVKVAGSERAIKHVSTKQEAVSVARTISRNQGTELVIHNKDGLRKKTAMGETLDLSKGDLNRAENKNEFHKSKKARQSRAFLLQKFFTNSVSEFSLTWHKFH